MTEENSTENKKINQAISGIAGKMFKLAQAGAKKLEDYAEKSAKENNNENAKKLAGVMNKISQNLENKHEEYIANVEKNTDDIINLGKSTLGKMKKVYSEMKTRAEVAKEKAEQDAGSSKELSNEMANMIVKDVAAKKTAQATEEKPAEEPTDTEEA